MAKLKNPARVLMKEGREKGRSLVLLDVSVRGKLSHWAIVIGAAQQVYWLRGMIPASHVAFIDFFPLLPFLV